MRAGHAPPFPQHEGMSLEITEELIARQPPEAQAIIRALLAKIRELQDRLNQSPRNSSSPPLRLTLRKPHRWAKGARREKCFRRCPLRKQIQLTQRRRSSRI